MSDVMWLHLIALFNICIYFQLFVLDEINIPQYSIVYNLKNTGMHKSFI